MRTTSPFDRKGNRKWRQQLGQSKSAHSLRAEKGKKTAFEKGVAAAKAGRPESACPYADGGSNPRGVDYGRFWRAHWLRGHRSVKKEEPMPP